MGINLVVVSCNTSRYVYVRRNLIRRLQDEGYSVHLLAPLDSSTPRLQEMGCAFTQIKMKVKSIDPWHDAAIIFNYLRIYRRLRPCVALHYTIKPNIYGSLADRLAETQFVPPVSLPDALRRTLEFEFLQGKGDGSYGQVLFESA